MPRAVALRPDFSAIELRCLARLSKDAAQARRLLALASSTMAARARRRHGSATSPCRASVIGCCASMPKDRPA